MPHNFSKIKLPPGSRSMSGDLILQRRGGEMWDKLKHYLKDEALIIDEFALREMERIEKEYGI